MLVFKQIIKFVIVGVSNTFIDFAVLNILIFSTNIASGPFFTLFKTISFLVAVTNSYIWNKRWTFRSERKVFFQFLVVSTIGLFLNVGTASFLVNVIEAPLGISEKLWANVGATAGTFVVMTWNFLGYKFVVFKAKPYSQRA